MCVRTVAAAMAACALAMTLNMSAFAKGGEDILGLVKAETVVIESLGDRVEIPEARECCMEGTDFDLGLGLMPFYNPAHPGFIGSAQVSELLGLEQDIQELSAEIKDVPLGSPLLLEAALAELPLKDVQLEDYELEDHLLGEVGDVEELRLGTLRAQEVLADLEEV